MTAANVSIRRAGPHDAPALCRLAALDSAAPLGGEVLMAIADGEPRAALSLADGRVVADPFRPTAALVELLAMRGRQLRDRAEPPIRARRLRWVLELAR